MQKPPSISEQLRQAIRDSGLSLNQLAKEVGTSSPVLWRFMEEGDSHRDIRLERTADKLAAYFRLKLVPENPASDPEKDLPAAVDVLMPPLKPAKPVKKKTARRSK